MWNTKLTKKMMSLYLPDLNRERIEYASVVEVEDLSDLPNTYMETAEFDCLHDDGIHYAQLLNQNPISVTLYETKGTMHGFDMAGKSPVTIKSVHKRTEFLKKIFR